MLKWPWRRRLHRLRPRRHHRFPPGPADRAVHRASGVQARDDPTRMPRAKGTRQGFESLRAHLTTKKFSAAGSINPEKAVRTGDNKPGSTTWSSSAQLDAAAQGAAAVRSEAEDERRNREHSAASARNAPKVAVTT
jgi:hypothetical protein